MVRAASPARRSAKESIMRTLLLTVLLATGLLEPGAAIAADEHHYDHEATAVTRVSSLLVSFDEHFAATE